MHRLLELVDLAAPEAPDVEQVRCLVSGRDGRGARADRAASWRRTAGRSWRSGSRRSAGARPERPFAFEHDGVLLHGRLDVLHRDGPRALVLDYKTNSLAEGTPEEIVEADYRLQRLVYALACFRAGAEEVEVVYHFLERPDAVVSRTFARADVPELEAELSEAIARIRAGEFRPTPSEFNCAGCPALDVVCAGPRLAAAAQPSARARHRELMRSPSSATCTATCPRSRPCLPSSRRWRSIGWWSAATWSPARCRGSASTACLAREPSSCAATPTASRRAPTGSGAPRALDSSASS